MVTVFKYLPGHVNCSPSDAGLEIAWLITEQKAYVCANAVLSGVPMQTCFLIQQSDA